MTASGAARTDDESLEVDSLAGEDEGGPVGRWVRRDPVRAVALLLILLQLGWRAQISARGFLAIDDFALVSHASESSLTAHYLFGIFNNHLMPAGLLLTWLVTKATGIEYWPYLVLLLLAQVTVDVAVYRLLRLLFRPGWGLLVPLVVFLFCPLTLELTAWWAVGINMLPMQLAMVWALGALVKYLRTGASWHLVTMALSLLFGLAFFEKTLLVVALLFLFVLCLYTSGGPVRSVRAAVVRYWPAWLTLVLVSAGYLALYFTRAASSLREPASSAEVLTFVRQLLGSTVLPGLVGGPWQWLAAGDGAPVVAPPELARWAAWVAVTAVAVAGLLARRAAGRAWLLLELYLTLIALLIAATRLGSVFSAVAGLVPRYVSDVVVVAAISLGAAFLARNDVLEKAVGSPRHTAAEPAMPDPAHQPPPHWAKPGRTEEAEPRRHAEHRRHPDLGGIAAGEHAQAGRYPGEAGEAGDPDRLAPRPLLALLHRRPEVVGTALVALVAVYLASAAWSAARFGDEWAHKTGRDYLRAAQADLATAPADTVFFDQRVPELVVGPLSAPYNLQSRFFAPLGKKGPRFVTSTRRLSIFDESGRIRHATVAGVTAIPGPDKQYGYLVSGGRPTTVPLQAQVLNWQYAARIAYLSDRTTTGTFRLGDDVHELTFYRGLHESFFIVGGGGSSVTITLANPKARLTTSEITVGTPVPWG